MFVFIEFGIHYSIVDNIASAALTIMIVRNDSALPKILLYELTPTKQMLFSHSSQNVSLCTVVEDIFWYRYYQNLSVVHLHTFVCFVNNSQNRGFNLLWRFGTVNEGFGIGSDKTNWQIDFLLAMEKGYMDITVALLVAQRFNVDDLCAALDMANDKGMENVIEEITDQ